MCVNAFFIMCMPEKFIYMNALQVFICMCVVEVYIWTCVDAFLFMCMSEVLY